LFLSTQSSGLTIFERFTAKKYPIRALAYAAQYGYTGIMDAAAPFTVFERMEMMKAGLNCESALFAWVSQKRRFEKERVWKQLTTST
jgi:hypothetical protein